MEETKVKIKAFLSRFFRKADLGEDEDIFAAGFVNSLFAMQLIMYLEKEFGIRVDNKDMDLGNFRTIKAIAAFVEAKAQAAKSA
jgi:methoxymalonate biosynthesis acyl carrier protein